MDDDDKPVLSGPTGEWVLIGKTPTDTRVIGPYPSAEDAQTACNQLGLPGIDWDVAPLYEPWS